MTRQYLITGGAGFIGVNLVRALISATASKIRVLDNLISGREKDLANLPVELIVGDIRDRRKVESAMKGAHVVIHLAANTGVIQSVSDPESDMAVNVAGTLTLLQAAVKIGVEHFIFASTGGAIVGDVDPPVYEDMPPRPLSPYGASKLAGEGYCSAFWGSYGLRTIPLRFSNVYGPYSYHKGSVIAKFFRQVKSGKELTIYGDGNQTRDFIFVKDLCEAIVTASQVELPYGRPIQLGTGHECSVNDLVRVIRQVVGDAAFPAVRHAPSRPGEVWRNFASIERAGKYLNFAPKTSLQEGLQQTWEWFQAAFAEG